MMPRKTQLEAGKRDGRAHSMLFSRQTTMESTMAIQGSHLPFRLCLHGKVPGG